MLTYSFTDSGSDSLYEHLYKCIRNDILNEQLRPGDKLPSKRSCAKNLGISTITVENAYEQLLSEGYIFSLPRKGYYVADLKKEPLPRPAAYANSVAPAISHLQNPVKMLAPLQIVLFSPETRPQRKTGSLISPAIRPVPIIFLSRSGPD